eukprot:6266956-Amphidinium_carterae.1
MQHLMDQASHATRGVNAVLTPSNRSTKLTGAVVSHEPRGELTPQASNSDRPYLPRLALVQRNKPGGVENDPRRAADGTTHDQRQVRLRDRAKDGVVDHPM